MLLYSIQEATCIPTGQYTDLFIVPLIESDGMFKGVVDIDFLKKNKIELDAILAAVGFPLGHPYSISNEKVLAGPPMEILDILTKKIIRLIQMASCGLNPVIH